MNRHLYKVLALVVTSAVFSLALRADARTFEADSAAEWAGAYYYHHPNMTLSMSLVITPDSRFNLTMTGCWSTSVVNHGSVAFRDGVLQLHPELPVEQGFTFESKSMIPVRFREKQYLVGVDRIGEFVATTAGGNADCRGHCQGFFVRESDLE